MPEHRLWLPQFRPVKLNDLMYKHWTVVRKLKQGDAAIVAHYWKESGLPAATGKRRVSLLIRLKPRAKKSDDDAVWKCLLDSLVSVGALLDDNRAGVEMGGIDYERGTAADWGTWIILTDLEAQ